MLQSFSASLQSSGYTYAISGTHQEGHVYDIIIDAGDEVHTRRKLPPDLVFANVLLRVLGKSGAPPIRGAPSLPLLVRPPQRLPQSADR